ncbi:MAG: cytochrome c oxidase subunit 3 [Bryobacteraceae bacterium]
MPARPQDSVSPIDLEDRTPGGRGPVDPGTGGGGGDGGSDEEQRGSSSSLYRLLIKFALISVVMLFISLVLVFFARDRSPAYWRPIPVPNLLWLSTGLLLASSATLEFARRALDRVKISRYSRLLTATSFLGMLFLISQLLALRQLVEAGAYLRGNPHTAMFYLLTGVHGLHLFGGLLAVNYLLFRAYFQTSRHPVELRRRRAAAGIVALYWHAMDGIWIGLFLLLIWRN